MKQHHPTGSTATEQIGAVNLNTAHKYRFSIFFLKSNRLIFKYFRNSIISLMLHLYDISNQITRSALSLHINTSNILTQHANSDELHAS